MNERVPVAGETLAALLEEYAATTEAAERDDWLDVAQGVRSRELSAQTSDKDYWLELTHRRLDTARAAKADTVGTLTNALEALEGFAEADVMFVLIQWGTRGYFVWLDPGLSRVVAAFSLRDKRA